MAETRLQGRQPQVDRRRVGISYSGGGALLLVELGVARAFVELGVRPAAIAGVSAGAIAGTAHAIDPVHGEGIAAAARGLERISNRVLGLSLPHIALEVVWERQRLAALGSNEPIQGLLAGAFRDLAGSERLTFGHFGREGRPRLIVGATDRRLGTPVRFPDDADVADALVASSAIPGVFPPKRMTMAGEDVLLIDGGVVGDQPLSVLALEGCGTIYGCAVGYDGERLTTPANLIDNWMQAVAIGRHRAAILEQAYVTSWLAGQGVVHHIHPEVPFPVTGFDFDRDSIARVLHDASEATKRWITVNDLLPPGGDDA
jgi:predicted acylesterase/phospholipase RssA